MEEGFKIQNIKRGEKSFRTSGFFKTKTRTRTIWAVEPPQSLVHILNSFKIISGIICSWSATHQAVATECAAAPEHAHRETWGLTRCGEGGGGCSDIILTHQINSSMNPFRAHFMEPSRTLWIRTSLVVSYWHRARRPQHTMMNRGPEEESLTHFFSLLPVWTVTCPDFCSCSQLSLSSHIFTLPLPPSQPPSWTKPPQSQSRNNSVTKQQHFDTWESSILWFQDFGDRKSTLMLVGLMLRLRKSSSHLTLDLHLLDIKITSYTTFISSSLKLRWCFSATLKLITACRKTSFTALASYRWFNELITDNKSLIDQ